MNSDENEILASLRDVIGSGGHRLDTMLSMIVDAARQTTGASGAALAMWKDGAMVCRARSGDHAPAIGARLDANTGISGECLRTGTIQHCAETETDPRVDAEVCRTLGLRSIAVLPIQGWRGLSGVLEVFSTEPAAFSRAHIILLEQLAMLAERARGMQPYAASPGVPPAPKVASPAAPSKVAPAKTLPEKIVPANPAPAAESARISGLLPASDRVGDVAFAFLGGRSRAVVMGAIGLVAILLVALAIWLGWRGTDEVEGKSRPATPVAASASAVAPATAPHRSDSDPVWQPNLGGQMIFSSSGKPSAGAPVKFASKVEVIAGKKTAADRAPLLSDLAGKVAADTTVTSPAHDVTGSLPVARDTPKPQSGSVEQEASIEPPGLAASTNPSSLSSVLSTKASSPNLTATVSKGVSGGELVHRVTPVYPAQALAVRLQGTVTLLADISEAGTVSDIKLLDGPQTLAQSAVEAVKQWRYKPYLLDGKPVKNQIRISVDFKFPSEAASR